MLWNSSLYQRYRSTRFAPFDEVRRLIASYRFRRVVDLGCDIGDVTQLLANYLYESEVLGLEPSPERFRRAQEKTLPYLRFAQRGIEAFAYADDEQTYDLVFSYAALHWVEHHERLIPALLKHVESGGQLVVQMPNTQKYPLYHHARAVASEAPFAAAFESFLRGSPVLEPEAYGELLFAHGCEDIVVLERLYPIITEEIDSLAEFAALTMLTPYLERLPPELQIAFMERFRERVRAAFPTTPAFCAFRHTLFAARRPAASS
jgi:trans-aconitate 2-methyltransferase